MTRSAESVEQIADTSTPALEQAPRPVGLSNRPYQFEVIPQVCLVNDVCRLLRFSERQFYRLLRERKLALVELPAFDSTRRFTGESVARVIKMRKGA